MQSIQTTLDLYKSTPFLFIHNLPFSLSFLNTHEFISLLARSSLILKLAERCVYVIWFIVEIELDRTRD